MNNTPDETDAFLGLPFDQYSRLKISQNIIRKNIPNTIERGSLKIIDLGGHKGHTADFFPEDDVTILDVFDESYPGYVKGDATRTDFEDNQFDIAVSFDTLEHIPKKLRSDFIKEASRISSKCFIIAAPFDDVNGTVSHAEQAINNTFKKIKGIDHPWLKEHLEFGIPKINETDKTLEQMGVAYIRVPTNNLRYWLLTQGLMFNASSFSSDIKEVVDVSRYYNSNLEQLESLAGNSYRQIYVASHDKALIESIKKDLSNSSNTDEENDSVTYDYLVEITNAYFAMIDRLHKDVNYLKERETHIQNEYDKLAKEYNELLAKIARSPQV